MLPSVVELTPAYRLDLTRVLLVRAEEDGRDGKPGEGRQLRRVRLAEPQARDHAVLELTSWSCQ